MLYKLEYMVITKKNIVVAINYEIYAIHAKNCLGNIYKDIDNELAC